MSKENEKIAQVMRELVPPLLHWYERVRRSYPWRDDPTPYHVWISEIMLQQTRIEAAKEYYRRFIHALPDIQSLAEVPEDELMKLWQGLGYYSRARNLKKAALVIMEKHGGAMPDTYEELLALPGIGAYTAGAIASIAFKKPVAAVDGNVLRVLARVLNDDRDIMDEKLKKLRKGQIEEVIPQEAPGSFNQGLMELGETLCLPVKEPLCGACPLAALCLGKKAGRVAELPKREVKLKRKILKKTVLLIRHAGKYLIRKREDKGLLAGLYEFPSVDGWITPEALGALERIPEEAGTPERIPEEAGILDLIPEGYEIRDVKELPASKHIFSHLEWHMRGLLLETGKKTDKKADKKEVVPEAQGEAERKQRGRKKTNSVERSAEQGIFCSPQEINDKYSVPTAFGAYLKCLKQV